MALAVDRVSAASTLVFVQPAAGATLAPGSLLTVEVTADAPIDLVAAYVRGLGIVGVATGPPFIVTAPLPPSRIGEFTLVAVARSGDTSIVGELPITIAPSGSLSTLTVSPPMWSFTYAGQRIPLFVLGSFGDGTQVDVTRAAAGTTYAVASGTATVVGVSPDGELTANVPGQDVIHVQNGVVGVDVPVTVEIRNRPPILAAIETVDLEPGAVLDLALAANDPDGDAIMFSALDLPAFAGIVDHADGTATLHLAPTAGDAGTDNAEFVTATDDGQPPLGTTRPVRIRIAGSVVSTTTTSTTTSSSSTTTTDTTLATSSTTSTSTSSTSSSVVTTSTSSTTLMPACPSEPPVASIACQVGRLRARTENDIPAALRPRLLRAVDVAGDKLTQTRELLTTDARRARKALTRAGRGIALYVRQLGTRRAGKLVGAPVRTQLVSDAKAIAAAIATLRRSL
ncbi:MAG TPA: hypothetical protein VGR62_11495 [Candidatus Binatia bacterium]|jgi:hypothetical protein|nr:hypothetical protein [Candidatus Binatia bacterium]